MKELAQEEKLLPCPFCGWPASLLTAVGESWVRCDGCLASTEMHSNPDTAISKWNIRTNTGDKSHGKAD